MDLGRHKIVLVGDAGVGKTTFLTRHLTGQFLKHYMATMGVEVHPLKFHTNYGVIFFNVWDTAGQKKLSGLGKAYYQASQAGLVLFDVQSPTSHHNVKSWVEKIYGQTGAIPLVICGNKVDLQSRRVLARDITKQTRYLTQRYNDITYHDISAKSNYNFEQPFLDLARALTGHSDLIFTEAPAIEAPTVSALSAAKL